MDGSNQKQLKVALLIVLFFFLFVFLFGFMYYEFYVKTESNKKNGITIDYSSKVLLKIQNKLPLSDSLGKSYLGEESEEKIQKYMKFTIENHTNLDKEFVLLLDKQTVSDPVIDEKYIKIYLTDEDDLPLEGFEGEPVPTFNTLYAYSKKPSSRVLYRGIISKNSSLTYQLRMWLADTYSLKSDKESFFIKMNIES